MSEIIDHHNLGTFDNLGEVYEVYRNGAAPGDYITVSGVVVYWDDINRSWGEPSPLPSVGETTTTEGDLSVGGNLSVSGQIENLDEHIKDILLSSITLSDGLRMVILVQQA